MRLQSSVSLSMFERKSIRGREVCVEWARPSAGSDCYQLSLNVFHGSILCHHKKPHKGRVRLVWDSTRFALWENRRQKTATQINYKLFSRAVAAPSAYTLCYSLVTILNAGETCWKKYSDCCWSSESLFCFNVWNSRPFKCFISEIWERGFVMRLRELL